MPKNILFIIDSLVGAGAERFASYLVNKIDKEQFKITLCLSLGSRIDYEISEHIKVYYLLESPPTLTKKTLSRLELISKIYHLPKIFQRERFRQEYKKMTLYLQTFCYSCLTLKDILEREKPDLILCTLTNSNIIALMTKHLFHFDIPVYCRIDNILSQEIKSLPYLPIYKLLVRLLYGKSDLLVAVSESSRQDMINNFNISPVKIVTVYNGVDIGYVLMKSKERLDEVMDYLFPDEKVLKIVAVGRLAPVKGHDSLLKALEIIKDRVNFRLFILGEGEMRQHLESLAKKSGLHDKVYFLGWQRNPFKIMAHCDLFVLSSLREGLSNVLLEAMSLGLPIVATNCHGALELLDNGKYGIVPPLNENALAEAIERVLTNNSLRNELSLLSHNRAMDFALDKMIKNYESLFLQGLLK